jgi:signal transduction histidine kinase
MVAQQSLDWMRLLFHGSVLRRLPAWLGFATLVAAMWLVIILALRQVYTETIARATEVGRNLARTLAEYELSSVRAIDMSLRHLREDWSRGHRAFTSSVERQSETLKREKVIQIAVVDRDGWLLYSKLPVEAKINFADRDYFRHQKESGTDELHISAPVFGRVTGQWAIQFTRPIYDAERRFAGLVVLAVPPPALEEAYNDIELGAEGLITLARDDGTILARSHDLAKGVGVSLAGMPGVGRDGPVSGEFRINARVDGLDRLFAYRRLADYPLTVYVAQSADTVLTPYRLQRNVAVGAGVLFTLLFAGIALMHHFRRRERAQAEAVRSRLEYELLEERRQFMEEREQLMLDLHDGCIQSIYAAGLKLESARRAVRTDPDRASQQVSEVQSSLGSVIRELRAFIAGEPEPAFDAEQFRREIQRLASAQGDRSPQVRIEVDSGAVRMLSRERSSHVLSVMREALSNVLRHAKASSACISLQRRGEAIMLNISDDGIGIAPGSQHASGLGLQHIQARARKLGGHARIDQAAAGGTEVALEFPATQ